MPHEQKERMSSAAAGAAGAAPPLLLLPRRTSPWKAASKRDQIEELHSWKKSFKNLEKLEKVYS